MKTKIPVLQSQLFVVWARKNNSNNDSNYCRTSNCANGLCCASGKGLHLNLIHTTGSNSSVSASAFWS